MKVIFLYILKFKNENLIKIGIAEKNSRIISHMRTYSDYGIDLVESYKVTAKNVDDIRLLEKQLLRDYSNFFITNERLNGRDGYTEIRDAKILNNVIEDIEYKIKRLPDKDFKIKKGIKIQDNKINTNKNQQINKDLNRYKNRNLKEHLEYINLLNRYSYNLVDIEDTDTGVNFIFDNLTDIEFDDLTKNHFVQFVSDDEKEEGYNIIRCSGSSISDIINPTNKVVLELSLCFDVNFTQIKNFRDEITMFIKNKRAIWRYVAFLHKYQYKISNIIENSGNVEIVLCNLTDAEYDEARKNCFIGFDIPTGGVNCGWGEGFPNDNKYIMGLQLKFSKEWDVVKPFRNEILRFIDNVKIIDKAS